MKHACRFCSGHFCVAFTSQYGYLCANCGRRYIKFKGNDRTRADLQRLLKESSR